MKNTCLFLMIIVLFSSCKSSPEKSPEIRLKEQIQNVLEEKMIHAWYPKCIDSLQGGYFSDFAYNWEVEGPQEKFIVTQSRHIWTLSFLYEHYQKDEKLLAWADQGFQFLKDKMWDQDVGGFFELTDREGNIPDSPQSLEKRAYGNAFAIYAMAQYYKVSGKEEVLDLAKKTFSWLDSQGRDKNHGGYFQMLHRDGTPISRNQIQDYNYSDRAQIGLKDYNSSIHLMEAFTTLYQVWPDSVVHARLVEMYQIITNKMIDKRGFLKLYFHPDWTIVSDDELIKTGGGSGLLTNHVTFGHDIETAYLLVEAAETLGIESAEYLPICKLLADHAILKGWDQFHGGLFDQGKYNGDTIAIIDHHKEWWSQAEAMNSLLLLSKLFPDDTIHYFHKFEEQWQYINTYLIDHQNGGWYHNGLDVSEDNRHGKKGSIWKGDYHTTRAMVNCLDMLKGSMDD